MMALARIRVGRPRGRVGAAPPRGLSIVELMVGIAIGLFILAGATMVATAQMSDNRQMLLNLQVQQDLRATAELISRNLRRAGYYARAADEAWPRGEGATVVNPYVAATSGGEDIEFLASQDERGATVGTDNKAADSDEYFGFRFNTTDQTIEALVGQNNWQALTDKNVIRITRFDVTLSTQRLDPPCGLNCPTGAATAPTPNCLLKLEVRDADIEIEAEATRDPLVKRSLTTRVRLRNDQLVCA